MSETIVKKSFMDKLTGFLYKTGHVLLLALGWLGVASLCLISGILFFSNYDKSKNDLASNISTKDIWVPGVIFIISIILIAVSLAFCFVKKLKKISDYFFVAVGLVAVTILAISTGVLFFGGANNGKFGNGNDLAGGLFIVSMILLSLEIVGGTAYSLCMIDNHRKEKMIKQSASQEKSQEPAKVKA